MILVEVAQVRGNLLAIPQGHAVVERELDGDGPLGVGGGGPLIQAAGLLRLDATHHAVVACVLNRNALGKHHLDMRVVKVASREAHAGANNVDDLAQVLLGALVVNTAGQGRLVDLDVTHGVHQQIGEVVGGIGAGAGHAAERHVDERLIAGEELGSVLGGSPHHLAHLDEHAAGDIKGLVVGQAASLFVGLVEGIHILVNAADGHTGLVLLERQQALDNPYGLHGLPEGARLVSRHVLKILADLQKLGAALGIAALLGLLAGEVGQTTGVDHNALGGVDNGLVEVNLVQVLGVCVVEMLEVLASLVLDVLHALLHQDDVVAGVGVAAAVYLVIGAVGDKGLTGELPAAALAVLILADLVERLALPEREELLAHVFLVLFGDVEGVLSARADGIELIAQPTPGDIGREGASARSTRGVTDDKLVVLDDQRGGLAAIAEALGAQLDLGHTRVLAGELGDGAGTEGGDGGHLLEKVLLQANMALGGAVGHLSALGVDSSAFQRTIKLVGDLAEHRADIGALLFAHVLGGIGQLLGKLLNIHRYSFSSNRSCF